MEKMPNKRAGFCTIFGSGDLFLHRSLEVTAQHVQLVLGGEVDEIDPTLQELLSRVEHKISAGIRQPYNTENVVAADGRNPIAIVKIINGDINYAINEILNYLFTNWELGDFPEDGDFEGKLHDNHNIHRMIQSTILRAKSGGTQ